MLIDLASALRSVFDSKVLSEGNQDELESHKRTSLRSLPLVFAPKKRCWKKSTSSYNQSNSPSEKNIEKTKPLFVIFRTVLREMCFYLLVK